MPSPDRQACIVGIGQTEYRKWGGHMERSELELACEAIKHAAEDAGVALHDIDGVASYGDDRNQPVYLQNSLGLPKMRWNSLSWGGGGAGSISSVHHAVTAIEAGAADYVVALRALCQGQFRRYGKFFAGRPGNNFLAPFGMFSPPIFMAPLVRRYMHRYGIRPEQIGELVLSFRDNATRNPLAMMKDKPLTMDDYLNARMIAEPLRLFDCTQENDGACAVLVTSLERARDLKQKPIRVLSSAQGQNPGWGEGAIGGHNMPIEDYGRGNSRMLADLIYGKAGVKPSDVDVAQIYDHFSGLVMMSIEDFGFCGEGEAGDFVGSGAVRWKTGSIPMNTSGGHLSEAYIHGLNLAIEGVRQLRGTSTSQVDDAEVCLVTGGSASGPASAMILGV